MARKTTRTTKPRTSRAAKPSPTPVRPAKPIFRAGTWITVLVFAALIAFAVYLNQRPETPEADATEVTPISYVFTSEDGLPTSIEVKPAEGDAVRIARNAENVWALELPAIAEADQGSAEAAATSVTTLRILNEIEGTPDTFGLDNPAYVITIEFSSGSEHTLEVGDITPTNSGYYVRLDKQKMLVVSLDGMDGLLNLSVFPPYLNTPTATLLPPTETPTAAPTSTPELTVTPTP